MAQLYTLQVFKSDTGPIGKKNGHKAIKDRNLEVNVVAEEYAIPLLKETEFNCAVLTRTKPRGNKPGAWYIKGYNGNVSYETILDKLSENQKNGKLPRECYLLTI